MVVRFPAAAASSRPETQRSLRILRARQLRQLGGVLRVQLASDILGLQTRCVARWRSKMYLPLGRVVRS